MNCFQLARSFQAFEYAVVDAEILLVFFSYFTFSVRTRNCFPHKYFSASSDTIGAYFMLVYLHAASGWSAKLKTQTSI